MKPNPYFCDVIVMGKKHRVKMVDYETYDRLIDRALAAAGYHHHDYAVGWELTSAQGIVLMSDMTLENHPAYFPLHLNPRAGINA